ncbi:class I SAM-dependent methyltransferase [Streptomyces huiliensis]|uniref:class I SAM-dependent methyltransferase n=1 Tax=Streptomyces huiliensis TaxID=2876027 RepID=UPI001CC0A14E|nr:class I SAM-dependent methyltransferase [Streptomyces huiliensis]MBZ4322504.1 class I SAM-dependent methyltransferase [Streptomyces huiliensis]
MDREKITLTGVPETLLATLHARACDSRSSHSLLHDRTALDTVRRIDYDFRRTGMNSVNAAGVALRARCLDDWTAAFLARHPRATVLHLACGLDTRAHRLARFPETRWIDVDLPEVVALRNRLLPVPDGDYRVLATSVTADGWLEELPADRPVVAVFEGLSMYLRPADGERLIRRITSHFPGGQLLFDCFNGLGVRMQRLIPVLRRTGATVYWGIDDPRALERLHPGLTCLDVIRGCDLPEVRHVPPLARFEARLTGLVPGVRDVFRMVRFEFPGGGG